MSDKEIFNDDDFNLDAEDPTPNGFLSNPVWKLRVNEEDPDLADIRTYHFDSEVEAQDLAQGLLVTDPCTDFTIFYKLEGDWQPQKTNKFDLFEDLDDFPNPLAVGQLLPNLSGQVDPDIIWDLTTGDFDAVELISDLALRTKALRIMDSLDCAKAWDVDDDDQVSCEGCGEMMQSNIFSPQNVCSECRWQHVNDDNFIPSVETEHCPHCDRDTIHKDIDFESLCTLCGTRHSAIFVF